MKGKLFRVARAIVLCFGSQVLVACEHPLNHPLLAASRAGDTAAIERLIAKGESVEDHDDQGLTPLIEAVWSTKADAVKTLLKDGANPNAQDAVGSTALHVAVSQGLKDIVVELVAKGARIDLKTVMGKTAVDLAKAQHPELLSVLSAPGANSPSGSRRS